MGNMDWRVVLEKYTEPASRLLPERSRVRALAGLPDLTEFYRLRPIAIRQSAGTHLSAMMQKSLHGGTPV